MTNIVQAATELCWEIEKLPCSEQQTKCSLMASELRQAIVQAISAERERLLETVESIKAAVDDVYTAIENRAVATETLDEVLAALRNSAEPPQEEK